VQGILRTNKEGGVIEIITNNSVVMEGRTYVNGADARITIQPGTFFELVQIAGAMYAPGENSLVEITAPDAVYINGEILAGAEWQGGVKVKVADGADVVITTPHELRIFGAITSTDVMQLEGNEDWDYNDRDEVDASIHLTGQLTSLADDSLLRLEGPDDIIIEGSIFVRGDNSGLYIDSGQRVKFATSFVEVQDDIDVFGRGQTADTDEWDPNDPAQKLTSSVFVDATAVITSFENGSNVNIWGAHDVDIFGSIVAGGSIGPTGVTWSGTDSRATIEAGEQVYLDSGVLASDSVSLIGHGAGTDDVSLDPDNDGQSFEDQSKVSVLVTTAGGLTSAGRTSDGSHGRAYIFGEAGVEMMGHIYSGANKSLLFDAEGNLIKEVVEYETSVGGDVVIESPGQVFIGGWAENQSTEVVLGANVDLYFDHDDDELTPALLVTVEASQTAGNTRLSQLIDQIQEALDPVLGGSINVKAEDNRVVFYGDDPFTITAASTYVNLLGLAGGDNTASEVLPDAEYAAPDAPAAIAAPEVVTLAVNKGDGTDWGEVTFTVEPGLDLQQLVDLLNDELDDSILNDFHVQSDAGKLLLTNAFDFQLDAGSSNVGVLGMTDIEAATVASSRDSSTYEVRAINSLFGSVLVTGGYIAAKDDILLQNVDTAAHPYTGPDIGVRIEGTSEITTHADYSSINVDSKYDAEIEGHLIAGGEVENIRDAETGGYIGSTYHDFGSEAAHTEINITAEHQVRIGTMIKAGGLIRLTGGDDPFEGDPDDVFNFTDSSVLIYGSAEVETWGENSQIILDGPDEINVLTPTHFEEVEPDQWVKGDVARIVSEHQFDLSGYLPVDVDFHLWRRDDSGEHTEWITIPSVLFEGAGADAQLIIFAQGIFNGSDHFSDIEVAYEGRYFMLTNYAGVDFAILDDSRNIDLFGLAPTVNSVIYYPDAELPADVALPTTGQLIADVTLDIFMEEEATGDTYEDSVTIFAAATADNSSLNDLVDDIEAALNLTDFEPIDAVLSGDKLMLTSLGYEFEILDTSENVNLLGLRGDWVTVEHRELSELLASGAAPTTGQLVRDVILVIRIDEVDLDDVLYDAITLSAASTADNASVADLVADINDALAAAEIPRYEGVYDFADYITAEQRDGTLVFIGTHDFKLKSASRQTVLLGMTPAVDLEASYVFFDAILTADVDLPGAVLAGNVTLDIQIERPGEINSDSVVIEAAATADNTTLADLIADINAALYLAGFDDLVASLDGDRLTLTSLYDFTIFDTSISAALLGITSFDPEGEAASSRQTEQYELVAAEPVPTTGVLAEDVTLDVNTTDSDDVITNAPVTILREDTLDNLSLDDLAADVEDAMTAAGLDITVSNEAGTLLFASENYDIEITGDSTAADLLGLVDAAAGTPEVSFRDPSVFELIGDDDLATTGILPDNVAFNIVMSTIDPNDDPYHLSPDLDEPDEITAQREDVLYGTVVVYRDDTLDNTGGTDSESLGNLIDDLNEALLRAGFGQITAGLDGSGAVMFSSPRAFEVDAEHAVLQAEAEVPAAVLSDPVTLDVRVQAAGGEVTASVVIAVDGENTSIEDLYEDVAEAFRDSAARDVYVRLLGETLEFYSRYGFTIEGTSSHADLLGLSSVAAGSDASGAKLEPVANAYVLGFSSVDAAAQEAVRPPVVGGGPPAGRLQGHAQRQHDGRGALRRSFVRSVHRRRHLCGPGHRRGGRHQRQRRRDRGQRRDRGSGPRYQRRADRHRDPRPPGRALLGPHLGSGRERRRGSDQRPQLHPGRRSGRQPRSVGVRGRHARFRAGRHVRGDRSCCPVGDRRQHGRRGPGDRYSKRPGRRRGARRRGGDRLVCQPVHHGRPAIGPSPSTATIRRRPPRSD